MSHTKLIKSLEDVFNVKVGILSTTRQGGCSISPFDSNNLGLHVTDDPIKVAKNRQQLNLPNDPVWLEQVHGCTVVNAHEVLAQQQIDPNYIPHADACIATSLEQVCAVMTADCLPVLIADSQGYAVAAVHCGWRSLLDGILPKTLHKMSELIAKKKEGNPRFDVWFGPAISQSHFEVGLEVKTQFEQRHPSYANAFTKSPSNIDKYYADLYRIAAFELNDFNINNLVADNLCTYQNDDLFYSYRRDGKTGRMASFIWLTS